MNCVGELWEFTDVLYYVVGSTQHHYRLLNLDSSKLFMIQKLFLDEPKCKYHEFEINIGVKYLWRRIV